MVGAEVLSEVELQEQGSVPTAVLLSSKRLDEPILWRINKIESLVYTMTFSLKH